MVVHGLCAGGMVVMISRLAQALHASGHEVGVTVTVSRGIIADELEAKGIRVSHVPAPGFRSHIYARGLSSHLGRVAPDVVHVHSGMWLKAARAAQHVRVPAVVYTMHG